MSHRNRLVDAAMRRPLTLMAAIVAVLFGAAAALQQMSRDVFPPLGIPTIYVAQPYGGMDAAQMEGFLTYYYEYHFLYITGIEHVESKSIQGASILKLQFHPGMDMSQAMAETINYANRARAFMPPGTVPPFIMRFDAGSVPVGNLVFSSDTRSVGQLQDAALNLVRPLFATLPGVSAPPPFGGSARSIVVSLKPERLRAYGLSPDDIVSAVASANLISPSGNALIEGKYPTVPLNSVVRNVKELETVPLRVGKYPAVFLRDVGEVADASDIVTCYALANGHRTVYIPVTKRANASTLSVVKLVKDNIPKFQSVLPDDVKVSYEFDQSGYVTAAIRGLVHEGLLGAVLTGLMVLLFLRDWRSALIVVVNIPLALLAAACALWLSGQSVNLMTLGGLALAVGILVDEATVTIENIHAHLTRGTPLALAAYGATAETVVPRLLAMLCVLAVFLPAFFMVGAARALFVPLALAVGFSMVASYLLSSTLVPVLSVWFLRGHVRFKEPLLFGRLLSAYRSLLKFLLPWSWVLLALYLVAAGLCIFFVGGRLGREIFPRVDAGELMVRLRAAPGTQLNRTEEMTLQALRLIEREVGASNVVTSLGFVGVHAPSYPINLIYQWNSGPEEAVLQVQFRREAGVDTERLKERLRGLFADTLPGVRVSFEPSDIISRVMSMGTTTPVEVAVTGPNLTANREYAGKLRDALAEIPVLRDLQYGQSLDYPTVDVVMDRERAGLLGVKVSDVSRSLIAATSSSRYTVPNYWADPNSGVSYQIQVQVPQTNMASVEAIKNVPVTGQGSISLLRNVAAVNPGSAYGEYDRYNMQRMITLTANIAGTDLGHAAQSIRSAIKKAGAPPPKVTVAVRGQVVPLEQLLQGLSIGLVVAVVIVFLLLAANFQSLRLALIVILTIPAVVSGILLALAVTGTTLNIQSFMGAVMAVGVAVANSILLVTFAERARVHGLDAGEAALEGATTRLRPILMTSCAMIAGMLPLAVGLGQGGEQVAPLGRAVVGGLLGASVATVVLLPVFFSAVQRRGRARSASLSPYDPESIYWAKSEVRNDAPGSSL